MPGASRSIVVDAAMDKCFDVIVAYEAYPKLFSEIKEVKIQGRQGNETTVEYKLDAVLKTIRYTLKQKEERPNRVTWSLVQGEFMKENRGSWVLEDAGP